MRTKKVGYVYKCSWNKRNPYRAYHNGIHVGYYETEAKARAAIKKRVEQVRK